jgi:hypothetical protein
VSTAGFSRTGAATGQADDFHQHFPSGEKKTGVATDATPAEENIKLLCSA